MALFKSKETKEEKPQAAEPKVVKKEATPAPIAPVAARVLLSARVTEKATDLSAGNVYVFNVTPNANKRQVAEAIKALYKVTPTDIRMVRVPGKSVRHPRAGATGSSAAGKKAYVQLKAGEVISLM